jgi:class 3 adenylate cyclase
MNIADLLNTLGDAVAEAKAKADVVTVLRADLAAYTTAKQVEIDDAVAAYTDAKVAADRLQAQASEVIGQILPAPDPRFRVSA